MSEQKLYADRDIMWLDELGNHYSKHVQAMTAESLHSKSDIAAELAFRDVSIAILKQRIAKMHIDALVGLSDKDAEILKAHEPVLCADLVEKLSH